MTEKTKLENERTIEEHMRFRDLVLQIERFLKYASRGTSPEVLLNEAQIFSERMNAFQDGFDQSKIDKLKEKLRKIAPNGGSA